MKHILLFTFLIFWIFVSKHSKRILKKRIQKVRYLLILFSYHFDHSLSWFDRNIRDTLHKRKCLKRPHVSLYDPHMTWRICYKYILHMEKSCFFFLSLSHFYSIWTFVFSDIKTWSSFLIFHSISLRVLTFTFYISHYLLSIIHIMVSVCLHFLYSFYTWSLHVYSCLELLPFLHLFINFFILYMPWNFIYHTYDMHAVETLKTFRMVHVIPLTYSYISYSHLPVRI